MGSTPGHCTYQCFMGAHDHIEVIDRRVLDFTEKHFPKFMHAPEAWSDISLSSLENYAHTQTPAPVGPGGPPRAKDPELPAWFRAMQQGGPPKS